MDWLTTTLSRTHFPTSIPSCCRSNNILPRHIINLSKKFSYVTFQNKKCKSIFDNLNNYFAAKLLKLEIKKNNACINSAYIALKKLNKVISKTNLEFSTKEKFFDFSHKKFFDFSHKKFSSLRKRHDHIHAKKFLSLVKGKNRHNVSHERANWLKNLSDTQVPPEVIDIVSLGPNFSHTRRVSKDDVLSSVKNTEQRLYSLDVEMSIKTT